ncbi:hypothetical protein GPECTOR_67g285 [Gonium pectorale]|uniref:Hemerythrin-like domain-containing protein n=1 Tax=Gonium pectorale TaxID=33097 RepID=A0A150G4I9_GONPE|nr:hypothetical protein GPECTOR_67g285 [Gonium pectorale]|eukprot:KXZ44445.1 hypothetical protein GPECTOR_67g285 [Gonium pectorale]
MADTGSASQLAHEVPVPESLAFKEPQRFEEPDPGLPASARPPTAAELAPAGADEGGAEQPQQQSHSKLGGSVDIPLPANGLDAIVADHQVIRQLFYRCDNAGTVQEKLAAARDLVRHISRHASAEERTLYPLVMDDRVNKQMLDFLESHVPTTEAEWSVFDTTLAKFRAIEEEHLSREEADVIDALRGVLDESETTKLGRKWVAAFANAPTHPHPAGPTAAAPARLLHPVVGLVDRVRDALLPEQGSSGTK